jgi:serine/threonine protein kinase
MDCVERFQYKTIGKYQVGRIIGKGEYSEVRLARDSTNGRHVAIKFISKAAIENGRLTLEQLDREVDCLEASKGTYVIEMLDFLKSDRFFYMVLEYCPSGSLFNIIGSTQSKGNEDMCRKYFLNIMRAVHHTHSRNVVHRDIKPENFLMNDKGDLVLSDFGFACEIIDPTTPLKLACGTPHYMAPEVLTENYLPFPVDIWSCGVLLYILVSGKMPFFGVDPDDIFEKIEGGHYASLEGQVSPQCWDLIVRMLARDPMARARTEEVFQHPWCNP